MAWPVGPILNKQDGGTGPIAVKKAVPAVAWPVGPILNKQDGGTGQIAVKKAVPTVAWPVGPILNKNVFRPRPPGVHSHTQEPILEIPPFAR